MRDRNPYRRIEDAAYMVMVVVVSLSILAAIVTAAWFVVEVRYIFGGLLGLILFWIVRDTVVENWEKRKREWDDAHRGDSP